MLQFWTTGDIICYHKVNAEDDFAFVVKDGAFKTSRTRHIINLALHNSFLWQKQILNTYEVIWVAMGDNDIVQAVGKGFFPIKKCLKGRVKNNKIYDIFYVPNLYGN